MLSYVKFDVYFDTIVDRSEILRTLPPEYVRHTKGADLRTVEGRIHDAVGIFWKQVQFNTVK